MIVHPVVVFHFYSCIAEIIDIGKIVRIRRCFLPLKRILDTHVIERRLKRIASSDIFIAGLIRPALLRLHLAHIAVLFAEELIDRRDLVGFADIDIPGRIIIKLIIRLELGQENILRLGIIADVFAA